MVSQAAEQGHAGAQFALGSLYYDGEGVEQDLVNAYAWFTIASAYGRKESIAKEMTAGQIAKAEALAGEISIDIKQCFLVDVTDVKT